MREIKFRLFYTAQNGDKSIIYDNDRYLVGLNGTVYENYGKSWKEPLWETVFDAECPPTISRFTGLKDKNGKEIYEGDIVEVNQGKATVTFRVTEGYQWSDWELETVEVIGNIFENPKL